MNGNAATVRKFENPIIRPGDAPAIPEPDEELEKPEPGKIYGPDGRTAHPTMVTTKNSNVVQIPQWAITTFGTFFVLVGFYAVSFYTQTNAEIKSLNEKMAAMSNEQAEKRKQEMQEMFNNAVKRGYELKAAEGDHGAKPGGKK